MGNHQVNLVGEQEHATESGLHPDLERAQDYAQLHQVHNSELDKLGGAIQQNGKLWMPPGFTFPHGAPQARRKWHAGRSTGIMRSFKLPMGTLIKHKSDPTVRFLFRSSGRKAWLLPALPFEAINQGMGLVAGEFEHDQSVEEFVVDASAKPKTLSAWAGRIVRGELIRSPKLKNFNFQVNPAVAERKCGFVHAMETVPYVKLSVTKKTWMSKRIPVDEVICPSKRAEAQMSPTSRDKAAGGNRVRRSVEWGSYDQLTAVPELRHKKLAECYAIFRPEQATWQVRIPARLRAKTTSAADRAAASHNVRVFASRQAGGGGEAEDEGDGRLEPGLGEDMGYLDDGEHFSHSSGAHPELCKCFGRTATGRVLCQKNVMRARRRTMEDCCQYMGIPVPVVSDAEEKAAWNVVKAYINATEKFNRYVEDTSDSDSDDLDEL